MAALRAAGVPAELVVEADREGFAAGFTTDPVAVQRPWASTPTTSSRSCNATFDRPDEFGPASPVRLSLPGALTGLRRPG
ncbi:MAG TPA: hypothetical protein VGG75_05350 [Trebonia sp.]